MTRKMAALLGALILLVIVVTPGTARVAPTAPAATPERVVSAPASPTDESKVPHYFGPYPNWANSPLTLPDATVTITAAAPVSPVTVGNALIARQYATDNTVGGAGSNTAGQGTVLVVIPTPLPAGTLQSFQTYTQNDATFGSPGNTFVAYVLHPTGTPDEYTIAFDSGPLLVPAEADGVHTWAAAGSPAVQSGDVIAFYGQGIPLDLTGTDVVAYPAPLAPTGTFVVGGAGLPAHRFAHVFLRCHRPAAGRLGLRQWREG